MPRRGFTLVELLVVIAIIGILASIGVASFAGMQGRARDAKRERDVHLVAEALIGQYLLEHTAFPIADPTNLVVPENRGPIWTGSTDTALRQAYDTEAWAFPTAPNQAAAPTVNDYFYVTNADGSVFATFTRLEQNGRLWFVSNSRGYSDKIDNSETIEVLPTTANTECADSFTAGMTFSPCLNNPKIQ